MRASAETACRGGQRYPRGPRERKEKEGSRRGLAPYAVQENQRLVRSPADEGGAQDARGKDLPQVAKGFSANVRPRQTGQGGACH
ncbi:hypothetical protein HPB50_027594 [Hyalomma asiaticum]|uniref:Uncharacterized protein n=1 Tax=Hyalomma asiaticum TaxID=266040 RepID=A0ACB7T372_HYAAI|nr:hypothetical protein HPB50_027594 [Hyalomma asiaticum]